MVFSWFFETGSHWSDLAIYCSDTPSGLELRTRAHHRDEKPERDLTYHLTCLLISYIFNGRRFTKRTFRVSLLSTFRVSRINYSLVCSLPIHTWSSANVDGPLVHCQLNPCKMLHKCSTDCIWKGLQPANDLECHSMSSPLLPFDRQHTISY